MRRQRSRIRNGGPAATPPRPRPGNGPGPPRALPTLVAIGASLVLLGFGPTLIGHAGARVAGPDAALSPCALLPTFYPALVSGNNSSVAPLFPTPPTSGNNSSGTGGLAIPRPPFNVTVGQLRAVWSEICSEPAFVQRANVELSSGAFGPSNFTVGGGWNRSIPSVSVEFVLQHLARCDVNATDPAPPANYTGPCGFRATWGAVFFRNGSSELPAPGYSEGFAGTAAGSAGGAPLGAPGPSNGTSAASVPGSGRNAGLGSLVPWVLLGALVVLVVAGAGAVRSRRTRARSGASASSVPAHAPPPTPSQVAPTHPLDAPVEAGSDLLDDMF